MRNDISLRRRFLRTTFASVGAMALTGVSAFAAGVRPRVVVIGGGFGGATAARYLSLWGGGKVDITLIEHNAEFVSSPMSNMVIAGYRSIDSLTLRYDGLLARGIKVAHGEVVAIDPVARNLTLADRTQLAYDHLVVSPGVEFIWDAVGGMTDGLAAESIPHAWKAGRQTLLLQKQLMAMKDGGVFAISIPKSPFSCPVAPYERACLVAEYFKKNKPRSKLLILDANDDVQSQKAMFTKVWTDWYPSIVEYRNNSELMEVDVAGRTAILEFDNVKADVLNVIPPQQAGNIARDAGLIDVNKRWCDVNWLTMESKAVSHIHVLGDATFAAPAMAKSGHMANQHAKIAAAAILALLDGREPNPAPLAVNACYSHVSKREASHIVSMHAYDASTATMQPVHGAGGISSQPSEIEARYAASWARNIWADSFG